MEPFAKRKAAADARRDSSDNMGDLVGCLSAWPATEAAPEVVDVERHAPGTAAARAAAEAARALEAAERARAWGQGPPETVIAQRRQHSIKARAAAKAALIQKPAVAERRVTLEGADGDTLHGVVAGTQSETALVLPPAVRVERRLVVEARVKTAASALRKMLGSANTKAVRDVLGLRVVVLGARADEDAHPDSLYAVRDALHCLGNELKHRYKDYVRAPKPSGYRSLHSTLLRPLDGLLVEVQVRSRDMHWHATFGDAAHAIVPFSARAATAASKTASSCRS